jgi:hypothetical protein
LKRRNQIPFKVLGRVDGARRVCALCRRIGGTMVTIRHYGHVDAWHERCASEYFGVPVAAPVVPERVAEGGR